MYSRLNVAISNNKHKEKIFMDSVDCNFYSMIANLSSVLNESTVAPGGDCGPR